MGGFCLKESERRGQHQSITGVRELKWYWMQGVDLIKGNQVTLSSGVTQLMRGKNHSQSSTGRPKMKEVKSVYRTLCYEMIFS